MKTLAYVSALLGASSAMVFPRQSPPFGNTTRELKNCHQPDDAFLQLSDQLASEEMLEQGNGTALLTRAAVTINTYVHVVAVGKKVSDGWVSDDSIKKQMDVINSAFKKRNIAFHLAGTTRTVNKDLSIIQEGESTAKLGSKLRKGDYSTLNLYIVKDMPGNVAGDCTFPVANRGPSFPDDGCRFNWDTLPPKSNGRVVIHEIGHWLGLMHTFQEGGTNPTCDSGHGDGISDTPVHLRPDGTKCAPMDTCPSKKGKDPIHNYMNYTPTSCWTGFTDGQAKRMHSMWKVRKSVH